MQSQAKAGVYFQEDPAASPTPGQPHQYPKGTKLIPYQQGSFHEAQRLSPGPSPQSSKEPGAQASLSIGPGLAATGQGESQGPWGPILQEAELLPNRILNLLPRHAHREGKTSDRMARIPFLFKDPIMNVRTLRIKS